MKHPPIAWSLACTTKAGGGLSGLGVRSTDCFNQAALAKLGWKIITDPQNWWVQIISVKYLRSTNFFSAKKSYRFCGLKRNFRYSRSSH